MARHDRLHFDAVRANRRGTSVAGRWARGDRRILMTAGGMIQTESRLALILLFSRIFLLSPSVPIVGKLL